MYRMGADAPTDPDHFYEWFRLDRTVPPLETISSSRLGGRQLGQDELPKKEEFIPPYKRYSRVNNPNQRAYAKHYQDLEDADLHQTQTDEQHANLDIQSVTDLECLTDVASVTAGGQPVVKPEEAAVEVYDNYNFRHEYDERLAITKHREEILDTIDTNQVTVIQGSTGSGKTTQVAQFILDHHRNQQKKHCNIIVTQPRRIATISIAKRVCSERQWPIGGICGYQVSRDSCSGEDTRLLYCTTGVLLRKLIKDRDLRQFTHIILDEVHERDQESDFCLLVTRKLLRSNSPGVKIILMSATLDSNLFANYFSTPVLGRLEPAPIISVAGRQFNVQEFYSDDLRALGNIPPPDEGSPGAQLEAYDLAVRLILQFDQIEESQQLRGEEAQSRHKGSVLVFLPGIHFIAEMDTRLRDANKESSEPKFWVCQLHSSIPKEDQGRVFERAPIGMRKVILSTNIAESSITVPDIKFVIDFCLTKSLTCDQETYYTNLQVEWASKSNCGQRKGRAGRVRDGRVYRMVPRNFYDKFTDHGIPEMLRSRIDQLVLMTKLINLGEPKAILALALSPPNLDDIERTIIALKEIGALASLRSGEVNPHDGEMTFLGQVMAELPCDPPLGRLMVLGHVFGLLEECIIISACLHLGNFFAQPYRGELNSYKSRLGWSSDTQSDCIAALMAYQTWEQHIKDQRFKNFREEKAWSTRFFIQPLKVKDVQDMVNELTHRLKNFNISVPFPTAAQRNLAFEDKVLMLKMVIAGAFYPNYFLQSTLEEHDAVKAVSGANPRHCVVVRGLPPNGAIYRRSLEKMFAQCSSDSYSKPKIYFESTRAIVEFPRDSSSVTQILPAVYLAVKLRNLRSTPLELELYSEEALRQRMQEMSMRQDNSASSLRSDRASDASDLEDCAGKSVELPSSQTNVIKLCISEVIDCGHFWAQYQDNYGLIAQLQLEINGSQLKPIRPLDLHDGCHVLALFTDETSYSQFYRARVLAISKQTQRVKVFYPDYGNSSEASFKDLRMMDDRFAQLPFQAFECELCGIRPNPLKCARDKWSKEAQLWFKEIVEEDFNFYGKVFSVVGGVVRLELSYVKENDNQSVQINQLLIQRNYAERSEETFLSKQNFLERERQAPNDSLPTTSALSLASVSRQREDDRPMSSAHFTGRKLRLKGPESPLEVDYCSTMHVGCLRRVGIERDSVNSISLHENPQSKIPRMMVAAKVGLNPSATKLIARETTLMPDIPGLHALLSMTFAPCVEFRTDPKRTHYIGALCGLGWDTQTQGPALPDHDMEVTFDVAFTQDDISMINQVRAAINLAVRDGSWSFDVIRKIQHKAKEKLLSLVQKHREPITETPFQHMYQWRMVDPDYLEFPATDSDERDFLTLLCSIELSEQEAQVGSEQRSREDRLQHLRQHRDWLRSEEARSKKRDVHCELCKVVLRNPAELLLHLQTKHHKEQELFLG